MKTNLTRVIIFATAVTAFGQTADSNLSSEESAKHQAELRQKALENKVTRIHKRMQEAADDGLEPTPFTNILVTQISRRPVTWTLDSKTCSLVKSTLTANGQGKTTVTALQNRDGSIHFDILDVVTGTATDAKGNEYIFLYRIDQEYDSSAIFPTTAAYTFLAPDNFQLIPASPGGQAGFTVDIYFNAKIGADGSFTDLGTIASQDPNCDPI